jgi:hypothetical protein
LRYCDGGSFAGNNNNVSIVDNTKLYFRGKRILDGVLQELQKSKNLKSATDVVISGCSAGGLATYLHADWWASQFGKNVKVAALPGLKKERIGVTATLSFFLSFIRTDSGWFVDLETSRHYQ